jgi:hypothetical protein
MSGSKPAARHAARVARPQVLCGGSAAHASPAKVARSTGAVCRPAGAATHICSVNRSTRAAPSGGRVGPLGYSWATTTSRWPRRSSRMLSPVSHSTTVTRSAGRATAIWAATGITSVLAIDPAAAMRSSPASESRESSSAACASSSAARTGSVRWTSTCPASVSRTRRPARSSSVTPLSRSSALNCCETADGVKPSDSAAAVTVPRRATSRSTRRRRTSNSIQ